MYALILEHIATFMIGLIIGILGGFAVVVLYWG